MCLINRAGDVAQQFEPGTVPPEDPSIAQSTHAFQVAHSQHQSHTQEIWHPILDTAGTAMM